MPQKKKQVSAQSLLQKIQGELKPNQSYLSLVLGLLIVIVAGVLVFNYFKRSESSLGPAQQTVSEETQKDVAPQDLPGKYTVKEGDTLFIISQNYYGDGYQYQRIADTNKLANADTISAGQVLDIPKLPEGIGGSINQTIWGERITGDTYTVASGDWLSTIAGRAYGDISAYTKIAQANNIQDPNLIEPGQTLKIPR